jgi:hypothetical protein
MTDRFNNGDKLNDLNVTEWVNFMAFEEEETSKEFQKIDEFADKLASMPFGLPPK